MTPSRKLVAAKYIVSSNESSASGLWLMSSSVSAARAEASIVASVTLTPHTPDWLRRVHAATATNRSRFYGFPIIGLVTGAIGPLTAAVQSIAVHQPHRLPLSGLDLPTVPRRFKSSSSPARRLFAAGFRRTHNVLVIAARPSRNSLRRCHSIIQACSL